MTTDKQQTKVPGYKWESTKKRAEQLIAQTTPHTGIVVLNTRYKSILKKLNDNPDLLYKTNGNYNKLAQELNTYPSTVLHAVKNDPNLHRIIREIRDEARLSRGEDTVDNLLNSTDESTQLKAAELIFKQNSEKNNPKLTLNFKSNLDNIINMDSI